MSILSVANVHFESTGANRIEYRAANDQLNIITTGNISITSRNFALSNNPGAVGNVLTSNGTTWISQALPSGLPGTGASGNVLTSNGTSWVSSTPTINLVSQVIDILPVANGGTGTAAPGTTGNVLVSNGTAWVSQAPGASGLTIVNESASLSTYFLTLSTVNTGTISAANTSSAKLYFVPNTGTLSATIFNSLSDQNHKTDIHSIDNPLEITDNLRGVWFKWVDNGAPSMGLIAQEVEKVLPQLVSENNGLKTLNYDALIGLLIEDIKALKAKIEKLEKNG